MTLSTKTCTPRMTSRKLFQTNCTRESVPVCESYFASRPQPLGLCVTASVKTRILIAHAVYSGAAVMLQYIINDSLFGVGCSRLLKLYMKSINFANLYSRCSMV